MGTPDETIFKKGKMADFFDEAIFVFVKDEKEEEKKNMHLVGASSSSSSSSLDSA